MTAITPAEQSAIYDSFARLLGQHHNEATVRSFMETSDGHDARLWQAMADAGMTGLCIDPEFGGIGAGAVEMERIMEQAGAALMAGPYSISAGVATRLIHGSGDADAKARLLPGIAAGQMIVTVAVAGDRHLGNWRGTTVTATQTDSGWTLNGTAAYVVCVHLADVLLVVARCSEGVGVYEVDSTATGLGMTAMPTWDRTLRLSRLTLDQVAAVRLTGLGGEEIDAAMDFALVAMAGEQVGAARHVMDMTVDYIKTRVQFGRPVGGFQALKHMAADLLLELESATSAARHAARSLAEGHPAASEHAALAAFTCSEAFAQVAATAIQMHGGIAFTWDHPAHLYLKRARACAQLLGTPSAHRDRFVTLLERSTP
jgi:alkylation response protein AidB-like acyl-CoA dehydrogenase